MSRPINSATIAELAKDSFITAHLVKIDFETAIYITECPQDLVYSGDTYNLLIMDTNILQICYPRIILALSDTGCNYNCVGHSPMMKDTLIQEEKSTPAD